MQANTFLLEHEIFDYTAEEFDKDMATLDRLFPASLKVEASVIVVADTTLLVERTGVGGLENKQRQGQRRNTGVSPLGGKCAAFGREDGGGGTQIPFGITTRKAKADSIPISVFWIERSKVATARYVGCCAASAPRWVRGRRRWNADSLRDDNKKAKAQGVIANDPLAEARHGDRAF